MQKRRVTSPDGTKWIVGRRWLLHPPRYFGFRFGVDKNEPGYEPPLKPAVERKPAPTRSPTPPVVRYKARSGPPERKTSRGGSSGGWSGGWGGNWGGFGGGGGSGGGRSSGGGSRGSSGGGKRGSSGGGKRGGGGSGGGGGAIGALFAALLNVLKWVAIVAAVIAVASFVVFVLIPALVFLVHYLAFWILVAVSMLYRALSGRPWIVEMEEADGYRVQSWRVAGWTESKAVIDEIAAAVRAGVEPEPSGAEPVEIVNAEA